MRFCGSSAQLATRALSTFANMLHQRGRLSSALLAGKMVRGIATESRAMRKMAVIGAGITGVTTARALMDRGFNVTVFDRHRCEPPLPLHPVASARHFARAPGFAF